MARSLEDVQAQINRYEGLLNEQLKSELQAVLDDRDKVYERINACLELRNSMKALQEESTESFKSMVDLGCDFYVQAVVPDTSSVYVAVGLGFHAQMTIGEAIAFATQREARLSETADKLTQRSAQLKARVKLVVGAIDELVLQARARDANDRAPAQHTHIIK